MTDSEKSEKLNEIYINSGYVGTRSELYRLAKENPSGLKITYADIDKFLISKHADEIAVEKRATLFSSIYANGVRDIYQSDIMIYDRFSFRDYSYILSVIDVYSRYIQCEPLKTMDADSIKEAYSKIFLRMGVCNNLTTDNQFNKPIFKSFFEEKGIKRLWFSEPNEDQHNAIVERSHRTLSMRIARFRLATGSNNWVKELPIIVDGINRSFQRTIKQKPIDVFEGRVLPNNDIILKSADDDSYAIGDEVRKRKRKSKFDKGDVQKWEITKHTIVSKKGQRYVLDDGTTKRAEDLKRVTNEKPTAPIEVERVERRVELNKTENRKRRELEGLKIWQGRETITIPSRLSKRISRPVVY